MTRVHLIGICGTAMATLAAMLKRKGLAVRGSDEHVYPPMSTFLEQEGIPILNGYEASHITSDLDLVIVGNAISRGNVELEEVLDRKIRYCSLPEAIRDHFLWGARSIVIAGTHGKTTTTALAGWLLVHAGLDPSVLVGGIAANLGDGGASYRMGQGRDFVIEGDEYDSAFFDKTAKFLKYLPDIAVVTWQRCGWRSGGWRTSCPGTGCSCSAPTAPMPRRWRRRRGRASRRSDWPTARTGTRTTSRRRRRTRHSASRTAARPSASSGWRWRGPTT